MKKVGQRPETGCSFKLVGHEAVRWFSTSPVRFESGSGFTIDSYFCRID